GLRDATAGLLAASTFIDRMLRKRLRKVHQPSLLMLAGHDRIVDNDATRTDFEKFSSKDREVVLYLEAHHTLEFEPDPTRYALDLVGWLNQRFPANAPTVERVNS
ncbi:alpha/beta hydrolase, partial [Singulisphaera rosea]